MSVSPDSPQKKISIVFNFQKVKTESSKNELVHSYNGLAEQCTSFTQPEY